MHKKFLLLLGIITVCGLYLRYIDYDKVPPWRESDDEIHYAWAGLTWLTKGTPVSWSRFESYPAFSLYRAWGVDWRLVSPMLEKPPLYSLLSGITTLVSGQRELNEVRLTTIRLLPIALSVITIIFIGFIGQQVFSNEIGLLAALLYAVTPTVVLSNRLSLTENLLTPLSLITLWLFLKIKKPVKSALFLGLCAGLSALTKQSGITVIIAFGALYMYQKRWRDLALFCAISFALLTIYPLIGFMYNGKLFLELLSEARKIGVSGGLPQLLYTLIGRPLVGTENLFPDGTLLLGYLLFLTSPWWFVIKDWKRTIFLAFPFTYLLYLGLTITGAETIGSGQGFWGWYAYPIFPYLIILVAFVMVDIYKSVSIYKLMLVILALGSSTIHFSLIFLPRAYHYRWQHLMFLLIGIIVSTKVIHNAAYRRRILWGLFIIFLGINIYTSFHLSQIYPSLPQPY